MYINKENEYQDNLKSILRTLDIKYEKTFSCISELNDKTEKLNYILKNPIFCKLYNLSKIKLVEKSSFRPRSLNWYNLTYTLFYLSIIVVSIC